MLNRNLLDIEIDSIHPFKHDALKRESLEPPLTQLITTSSGPLVLGLDGDWGSGKTTFLKMWKEKLTAAQHFCIYLNAWETDFVQDPLIAFVGELISEFEVSKITLSPSIKEHSKKLISLLPSLLKAVVLVGSSINGIDSMPAKAIADLTGDITEYLTKEREVIIQAQVKNYSKIKSEIKEFKRVLEDYAQEVSRSDDSSSSKLIIMVDELDRCRPDYAIRVLERIKHFFDISGIVFIIGMDRNQLCHSICGLYGERFNSSEYLKKFIDLEYRLPYPEASLYINFLFEKLKISSLLNQISCHDEGQNLKNYLCALTGLTKMSLRQINRIIIRTELFLRTIPHSSGFFESMLSVTIFLKEWDSNAYYEIFYNNNNDELEKFINTIEKLMYQDTRIASKYPRLLVELQSCILAGLEKIDFLPNLLILYRKHYKQAKTQSGDNSMPEAIQVIENIEAWKSRYPSYPGLRETLEGIEILDSFRNFD